MELIQKYWYFVVAGLVLLFLMARRGNSSATTITQLGGGADNTLALANLASAEREADEGRKYGLVSTILNYQLADKGLSQQIDLAKISAQSQTEALKNQYLLASLSAQLEQNQFAQQYQLQNYALQSAYNNQRRNDWLGAISTGIQTIVPTIFGRSTVGGNIGVPQIGGTPPFSPVGSWSMGRYIGF